MKAATGHVTIDVAFWGGIIPGNQVHNLQKEYKSIRHTKRLTLGQTGTSA